MVQEPGERPCVDAEAALMALINQPIPNLYGGVSQQPPLARFMNQLDSMVNCSADPVEGLAKRPPTEHVKKIIDGLYEEGAAVFPIDRDPDNRFIAVVRSGSLKVIDTADGAEMTVNNASNTYLNTTTPRTSLRSLTIADYTFIVNRDVTVAKTADTAPTRPNEALIFVRAGNYGKDYKITIKRKSDDTQLAYAYYRTPNGAAENDINGIDTAYIASVLYGQLNGTASKEIDGSVIYLTYSDEFYIEVEDGQGKQALKAYAGEVQRFSDLPEHGKEGIVLKVVGDQTSAFDDYWVRFNGTVWEETLEPGLETSLDPSTMPHALVRNPDDSFDLIELPWVDRAVGDNESAPFPSITGLSISSLFYFRNRLGFLADENVLLSQAGDYFNLFPTTITQVLDSDPIDVVAGDASGESSPVSILEHAVAFDRKLVLFARNAQFIMGADGVLTPNTATIDPVTSFQASARCRPVSAGRFIYFTFDRDGASGVREFYVDGAAQTEDAIEVTAHCPTYLPTGISRMTGSTLENVILAISEDTPNKMYVYEYFWSGQEKLQSAWGTWEFEEGATILSCDFFDNIAYLVVERADGYHLERIRFRPGLKDTGLSYFTHLDRRVLSDDCTMTYSAQYDRTDIVLPYAPPANTQVVTVYSEADDHAPGIQMNVTLQGGNTISVPGDKTSWKFVIGVPYEQSFGLTRPYYLTQAPGGGLMADTEAVIKVRDYLLDFTAAGYFKATFTPKYRDPVVKEFSGRILGATELSIPDLDEGTFRIKTPCKNTYWALTISNDSPFPSSFLAASWRGLMTSKSQRV
jgi:hypothetical protein